MWHDSMARLFLLRWCSAHLAWRLATELTADGLALSMVTTVVRVLCTELLMLAQEHQCSQSPDNKHRRCSFHTWHICTKESIELESGSCATSWWAVFFWWLSGTACSHEGQNLFTPSSPPAVLTVHHFFVSSGFCFPFDLFLFCFVFFRPEAVRLNTIVRMHLKNKCCSSPPLPCGHKFPLIYFSSAHFMQK